MGKASRRKGAEGEQAVARLFREAGWDVRGVQRGAADAGDLLATMNGSPLRAALAEVEPLIDAQFEGHDGIAEYAEKVRKLNAALDVVRAALAAPSAPLVLVLDSKRQERIRLLEWSRQVEGIARDGEAPCVVWRPSREPWRVSLRLDDLLGILAS